MTGRIKFRWLTIAFLYLSAACTKPDHTDILQEIKSVDKMVFASMSITKTAKMDKSLPMFGKRIAVYSYDSYMRAYIDLSSMRPEDLVFDESDMSVRVILPPVQTEVTGRDMNMRKVYENVGILRGAPDAKERAEIKEKANASFKTEIEDNPRFKQRLTETARRKAEIYFKQLFEAHGYTLQIEFRSDNIDTHATEI
ncbi:MAG: DUF4230 domain-containing protein [Muribaculaceae bacterium]|nr:DUF4230 domain-containing protein [Muribaculaceae bacterium]